MKKQLMTTIVLAIIIAAMMGCTSTPTGKVTQEETITIGWVGPLSGSVSQWGEPALKTAQMAVEDINNKGGIKGQKLELIVEDSQSEPRNAVTAAQKFIGQDGVKIILTHLSSESLVIAPLAEEAKVIMFASATSTPDLTNAGDHIFRVTPVNKEGETIAAELNKQGVKKVALITEQAKYSLPIKAAFEKSYTGTIVLNEEFSSDSLDSRTLVTKIKESGAEAIVLLPESLVKISEVLKTLQEQGVEIHVYGNAAFNTPQLLDIVQSEHMNLAFATLFIDEDNEQTKTFMEEYEARYGAMPNVAHTLDAAAKIYVLAEGLELCGEDTECLKDFLYSINEKETVSGILTIDEFGDAEKAYVIKRLVNGHIV